MLSEVIPVMVFQGLVFGVAGISSYVVKLSLLIAKFTALAAHLHPLQTVEMLIMCHYS